MKQEYTAHFEASQNGIHTITIFYFVVTTTQHLRMELSIGCDSSKSDENIVKR